MSRVFENADATTLAEVERYLWEFFGVEGALSAHRLWLRGTSVWVAPAGIEPPRDLRPESFGMLVSRRLPPRGQLTAPFIRRFCASATRRVVELAGTDGAVFLRGDSIVIGRDGEPDGPRLVRVDGRMQGRGRLRDGLLECELPKELRVTGVG